MRRSHCPPSTLYHEWCSQPMLGNTRIYYFDFADDTIIFAESLETIVMALETLHKDVEPLVLQVSWIKTKSRCLGIC